MTFDKNTKYILRFLYPALTTNISAIYEEVYKETGLLMRATEGFRSMKRQFQLYQQGRDFPGKIVTWAKPGSTLHNYGMAVDSCFTGADPFLDKNPRAEEIWGIFGKIGVEYGLEWGGNFKNGKIDRPHMQLNLGMSVEEMYDILETKGLAALWQEFDRISGVPIGFGWKDKPLPTEGM